MVSFRVTEQLARASARRPWVVVGLWVVLFLAGGFLATGIGDVLTTEFALTNEPESVKADQLLEERLRGSRAGPRAGDRRVYERHSG